MSEENAVAMKKLDLVKKELGGFFNPQGFSTVLNASNPLAKLLWVSFFLVLFILFLLNVIENINDFCQYTVITEIKTVNEYPMTLPAVTFCLSSFLSSPANLTLEKYLLNCSISGIRCDTKDFYSYETKSIFYNSTMTCYVLNGGRNSSGSSEIKSARKTGYNSGFVLYFVLPDDRFLNYYINDAYVKPTLYEFSSFRFILPGTSSYLGIEKTVESKLEFPFNNCRNLGNFPDSHLVRQLSEANVTYRQVNCFENCYQNFVKNYALKREISENEAELDQEVQNYDTGLYCNEFCPLECESIQYKITEKKFNMKDIRQIDEWTSNLIPSVKNKLNITINSTKELKEKLVEIMIGYDFLKYTKISQTAKTTLSGLISNIGGSSGVFLDLTLLSVCRAVEFILGVIFGF